jgi:hypothetical protein
MHAAAHDFESSRTHHICPAYSAITISFVCSRVYSMLAYLHTTSIAVAGSSSLRGNSVMLCLQTSFACMHTSARNAGSGMRPAGNNVARMAAYYPKYTITLFCFAIFDPATSCAGSWWQEEAAACAQV